MNSIMRSSRFGCFTIVGIFLLEIPVPGNKIRKVLEEDMIWLNTNSSYSIVSFWFSGVVASYNMEQDTCAIENKDTISKLSLFSRERK